MRIKHVYFIWHLTITPICGSLQQTLFEFLHFINSLKIHLNLCQDRENVGCQILLFVVGTKVYGINHSLEAVIFSQKTQRMSYIIKITHTLSFYLGIIRCVCVCVNGRSTDLISPLISLKMAIRCEFKFRNSIIVTTTLCVCACVCAWEDICLCF